MTRSGNATESLVEKTMERDMILALGGVAFIKDRMMEQSDEYRMWVCDLCGLPAMDRGDVRECLVCQSNKVSRVRIPYSTKLVFQEFMAMNIVPRIMVTPYNEIKIEAVTDTSKLEKIVQARERLKVMKRELGEAEEGEDTAEILQNLKKKVDTPKKVSIYRKARQLSTSVDVDE